MSSYNQISVKQNFLYNIIVQVAVLIIPFVTTPYVSRVLGAENIGKYSYATSIVTYFTLIATLGSTIYGQRKIAFYRDNIEQLSQVFWNTFAFRCISSLVSLVLYFNYIYFVEGINIINVIVSINIIDIAINVAWFFQGIEDFKKIAFRSLFVRIMLLVCIFVFIRKEEDLWMYALIMMISIVLGNIVMWVYIPKHVILVKHINPFDGIKEIWLIFLPSVATQIYTILDKSMIGWITGSDYANGCYEQSERIARLAITVVTSVGTVILPRVANLYQNNKLDEAKKYVYKAFRVVWMLSFPMMFGLISVSSVFIPLFLGNGFEDSVGLLMIFSILIVVVSIAYIVGLSYLVPTEQQNVYTISVTIAAICNFVINIILIPVIGAFGAAIASIIAEIIGATIQVSYCIIKKQLEFKYIFGTCWKYVIASLAMYIIVCFTKVYFSSGLVSLGILIVVGGMVYFSVLALLKEDLIFVSIKKIIKKVLRMMY